MLFVEDGMRKLLFEAVLIQELLNSPCNDWLLKNLIYIRSSVNVHGEHLRNESFELTTEMSR